MGRAPSWVVRWGITVIFVILALIVLGCYIIKYPQTVTAPISITTVNAPSDLTARYDGLLDSVCVGNGENVRTGQLIALLATPADYDDIRSLEEHLSATDSPQALAEAEWVSDRYILGDLQSTWAEFAARCLDFRHYLATDLIGTKKRLLEAQIAKNKRYYAQLEAQGKLLDKDLAMGQRILERDSLLFTQSVISAADYETSAVTPTTARCHSPVERTVCGHRSDGRYRVVTGILEQGAACDRRLRSCQYRPGKGD